MVQSNRFTLWAIRQLLAAIRHWQRQPESLSNREIVMITETIISKFWKKLFSRDFSKAVCEKITLSKPCPDNLIQFDNIQPRLSGGLKLKKKKKIISSFRNKKKFFDYK